MAEMSPAAQAAAELVADAARLTEAPEGEQPAEQVEAAPDLPSFEADLSGLDEDIFTDEPEDDEPAAPTFEEPDPEDEYDPEKLRAQLAKERKRAAWLEEQNLIKGRKQWKAEIEKRFSLADADEIVANSTSHRAALRKANEQHTKTLKKLQPFLAQMKATSAAGEEQTRQELYEEAGNAWGRPSAGPSQPLVEEAKAETEQQLDRRRSGSVHEMVKKRFASDPRFKGQFDDLTRGG